MINKIQFSVNIFIYIINTLICVLYYKIFIIDLDNYHLSEEYISQKDIMDQMSLGYSIFLLIFCLIYVVIYKEIYGNDLLKDLFITGFYILLTLNMIYINNKNFSFIKKENENLSQIFFDIPIYPLEKIRFLLVVAQGLIVLLIVFTVIKELIACYRTLKNLIIINFGNGRGFLVFEIQNLIT